jgi:energy-coupling factor transport system permease protein
MFVLTAFLYQAGPGTTTIFHLGFLTLTVQGMNLAIISMIRFIEIVIFTSVYTLSTTLSDVTHSLERLLSPLRIIRFPVHETALIVTIALRFVPTFAQEAEKIMKAQASRGASFGTTHWWQIVKRTASVFPIIVPLFLSAMRRADDLVLAMEARGYIAGAPRTSYIQFDNRMVDGLFLVIVSAVCGAIAFIFH